MIRRRVPERLSQLASFITWDIDPYLVITESGRLVWIVDGYTTSESHPYSRSLPLDNGLRLNPIHAIRLKRRLTPTTAMSICIFSISEDPLIAAYQHLFPELFTPGSAMPADLRAHVRSPEVLFRAQAEIFRTYHMRDPESLISDGDTSGMSPPARPSRVSRRKPWLPPIW